MFEPLIAAGRKGLGPKRPGRPVVYDLESGTLVEDGLGVIAMDEVQGRYPGEEGSRTGIRNT